MLCDEHDIPRCTACRDLASQKPESRTRSFVPSPVALDFPRTIAYTSEYLTLARSHEERVPADLPVLETGTTLEFPRMH